MTWDRRMLARSRLRNEFLNSFSAGWTSPSFRSEGWSSRECWGWADARCWGWCAGWAARATARRHAGGCARSRSAARSPPPSCPASPAVADSSSRDSPCPRILSTCSRGGWTEHLEVAVGADLVNAEVLARSASVSSLSSGSRSLQWRLRTAERMRPPSPACQGTSCPPGLNTTSPPVCMGQSLTNNFWWSSLGCELWRWQNKMTMQCNALLSRRKTSPA